MNIPVKPGVAGAGAHLLIGGMSDVGRGLGDAARESGHEGRSGFRQQYAAHVVVVAGHGCALGIVHSPTTVSKANGTTSGR